MVAQLGKSHRSQLLDHISKELCIPCAHLDTTKSFARLGGHSISAIRLSHTCRRSNLHLPVAFILKAPSLASLIQHVTTLPKKTSRYLPPSSDDGTRYHLTEMQLSLIHGSQAKPGHNIITYHHFCREDVLPQMKDAWQKVLSSEPIFQTKFILENGQGYMLENKSNRFQWTEAEVSSKKDIESYLEPPVSMTSVDQLFTALHIRRVSKEESFCCIIWHVHHALIDGYSMKILLDKLFRVLEGRQISRGPSFAKVSQQLQQHQVQHHETAERYWLKRRPELETAVGRLKIPGPQDQVDAFEVLGLNVEMNRLQRCAQDRGVTVTSMFMAAWALVLSIYCDSDVVSFGVAMSGRSLDSNLSTTEVVGPLVNVLPFSINIDWETECGSYLIRVFEMLAELAEYEWSPPSHGYNRLYDTMIAMQLDTHSNEQKSLQSDKCQAQTRMRSDLSLSIMIEPLGRLVFQYNDAKLPRRLVEQMAQFYIEFLYCFDFMEQALHKCHEHVFSTPRRAELLTLGNCISGLTTKGSIHEDLVSLFLNSVRSHPEEFALEKQHLQMTYRQLYSKVQLVADRLKHLISPDEVVAVHADQSLNWIVAIYAILLAQGVYCPLNTNLSPELRESTFISSGSRLYLVPNDVDKTCAPRSCATCLTIEELLASSVPLGSDCSVPCYDSRPGATAYLCFTSGSTGKPKGVMCSHRSLVAFQSDLEVRLTARCGERIAQIMSPSFDGSIHEIFSALSYGATLVLPDMEDMFAHLHRVDTAILTPSLANILDPKDYRNLARVYLVGEAVSQQLNDTWAASIPTYNMYGPTEATGGATIKRLVPNQCVTIGRPNPSTRIYILDRHSKLAPVGVIGMIFLAGVQISNGYLNRPDATASSFFADRIITDLGEQMYRTGDLGFWNSAGELVCLGRNDRQVKLRGFRLELDDIEARINKIENIRGSAVTVVEDHLVAMVQPGRTDVDVQLFLDKLRTILPAHAIPRKVFPVDSLPRTTAGKVDYAAIKAAAAGCSATSSRELSSTELAVVQEWQKMVPSDPNHDPLDSSFEMTSIDSLQQLRLASRLSSVFDIKVSVRDLIVAPTLHDLALQIEQRLQDRPKNASKHSLRSLSFVTYTELIWARRHFYRGSSSACNVAYGCKLETTIRREPLIHAWNQVLQKYDLLRSVFIKRPDGSYSRDLSSRPPSVREVNHIDLELEINLDFCLERDMFIRVLISRSLLLVVASHIICDLTTLQLLLNEVGIIYQGLSVENYQQDYVNCSTWNETASLESLKFWSNEIRSARADSAAERNCSSRQPIVTLRGRSQVYLVPETTSRTVDELVANSNFTYHQVCLAAVGLARTVNKHTTRIVLGSPHLNRKTEIELKTVGLFLEPLPIAINFEKTAGEARSTTSDLLVKVQEASQEALANAVPWNQLVEHLHKTIGLAEHEIFDTMVTFHDKRNVPKLALDDNESIYLFSQGTKFHLMCEFLQLPNGRLLLRVEHDESFISSSSVQKLYQMLCKAFESLEDLQREYSSLKTDLLDLHSQDAAPTAQDNIADHVFGKTLTDISKAS